MCRMFLRCNFSMFKPVKSFPSFLTGKKRGTCTGFRIMIQLPFDLNNNVALLFLIVIVQQSSSCIYLVVYCFILLVIIIVIV